ncbi:hypothetical protein ANN_02467 [Periplaneta americana]|uniref:Uncharacterized protein n=1 Tax=Periplaneta americana TaxID=6978 RepID=A0ABQ8TWC6_PERAM|nr:hypothetical protein ANN_02467 [Periplaneta americana]
MKICLILACTLSFLPQYAIGSQDFVECIVTVTRHEKRKGQAWSGNQEIQGRDVSLPGVGYHLLGSESSITRIRREGADAGETSLSTLGKHRKHQEERNVHLDDFDKRVIRDTIRYCNHMRKLKTQYWEKAGLLENTMDEFIIALESAESDTSDSSDSQSDEESDDTELARPLSDSE